MAWHDVYLKAHVPPDPATDSPAATVAAPAETVDLVGQVFPPNAVVYVAVYARNDTGTSDQVSRSSFRTGPDGKPLVAPAPVADLRAVPVAGGYVDVSWSHTDQWPLAAASHFSVQPIPLATVLSTPSPTTVLQPEPAPARVERIGPLAEGLWRIRVTAVSAGGAASASPHVYVRTRSSGPAVSDVVLEAA